MDAPKFENLDLACARAGRDLVKKPKDLEKLITSALAVLEEQGLYALFLYLKTRGGDESEKLKEFLEKTPQQNPLLQAFDAQSETDQDDIFIRLEKMAEDLDRWLLARDLLRQVLVYAKYHARLREEESEAAA